MTGQVDVFMTAIGGKDTTEAIQQSAARLGYETARQPPAGDVHFADYPFSREADGTIEAHVDAVAECEPAVAVAPDVENGRSLADAVEIGDRLLDHADHVVIAPKTAHPAEIPDRFRVGVPAANFGSSAPWTVSDYLGSGPVHLLGGGPRDQQQIGQKVPVASLDTSSFQCGCQFGEWWVGKWVESPDHADYYDRLRTSLDHYASWWGADVDLDVEHKAAP